MKLILKVSLSKEEKEQVLSLEKQCNEADLSPSSPETEPDPEWDCFFLLGYSHQGCKALGAFLSCMLLRQETRCLPEATFTLHVRPDLRRQGIGTMLLKEMVRECRNRCQEPHLILNTYTGSAGDGRKAAKAMGFEIKGSQLLMSAKTERLLDQSLPNRQLPSGLTLRPCRNRRILASLYHRIFSVPLYAGRLVTEELLAMPEITAFVLFQEKKPLGMAMILTEPGCPYLFNVGVLPEHQRKHLATRMLSALFHVFPIESKKLSLQVSGENLPARKLYESLGFSVVTEILEQAIRL